MKHYWLRLYPEQPVTLEDEYVIPAGAIRGALAAILLSTCVPGHQHDTGPCSGNCRYWSLFGESTQTRIGPAYAGTGDETMPLPITTRTCAAYPGFKGTGGHGIFDTAIRTWVFEQVQASTWGSAQLPVLVPPHTLCPTCDSTLTRLGGPYTRQGERDYSLLREIATPVVTDHVSLARGTKRIVDRHTETGLFIRRGIYFVARLDVADRHDGLLREAIRDGLWIGGRKSRGMGAMRAELIPREAPTTTLNERIAHFNRVLRGESRFYAAMGASPTPGDDGDWFFALDLDNPTLPAYDSAPSVVSPLLKMLPSVVPVRRWLAVETVGGWHMAAGLPRRTQLGVRGVILCRVPADVSRSAVEEALTFIEADGIGSDRERGYGSVTVCDPFHTLIEPV